MNNRAAYYFHPIVTFCYIIGLTVMAMIFFHPVFLALGIFFAVLQCLIMCGRQKLFKSLLWSVPLCVIIALFNPIVCHRGKTVLFHIFDSTVTLEALFYGICSGAMLFLIFLFFNVYNRLVTPDRFMYIFSRFAPSASMLITMTQRMIPLFTQRFQTISAVQRTLRPAGNDKKSRFRTGLRETSILLSWSMEDGLDTADSMKARGYGSEKRSQFSIYRFTLHDALALAAILAVALVCVTAYFSSAHFSCYPRIKIFMGFGGYLSAAAYTAFAAALPIIEGYWALMWKLSERNSIKKADIK